MNEFLNQFFIEPITDLTARQLLVTATQHFYAFTLVVLRLSGLMTIGPIFGQSIVPANVRILLAISLAFVITPALHNHVRLGFDRLDSNQNGLLAREEVPEHLQERYDRLLAQAGKNRDSTLERSEYYYTVRIPSTILDYLWLGVGEFAIGLVMGLGVLTILTGLQLAGELIDQQTGIALGEISNPGLEINGSITGQMLFMLATAVLLVMEPFGFHLLMMSSLVETFQTLPLGEVLISTPTIDLLRDLVHQSLVLGVQIAAPLLATMSLVALTMGFLGHTVPQINVLVIGFPIRAIVSLLVLSATLSGASRAIVDIVPRVIDDLRNVLMFP